MNQEAFLQARRAQMQQQLSQLRSGTTAAAAGGARSESGASRGATGVTPSSAFPAMINSQNQNQANRSSQNRSSGAAGGGGNRSGNQNNNSTTTTALLEEINKKLERERMRREELENQHRTEIVERDLLWDSVSTRFLLALQNTKGGRNNNNNREGEGEEDVKIKRSERSDKNKSHKKWKYEKLDEASSSTDSDHEDENNDEDAQSQRKKRNKNNKKKDDEVFSSLEERIKSLEKKLVSQQRKLDKKEAKATTRKKAGETSQNNNNNSMNQEQRQFEKLLRGDDDGDDEDDDENDGGESQAVFRGSGTNTSSAAGVLQNQNQQQQQQQQRTAKRRPRENQNQNQKQNNYSPTTQKKKSAAKYSTTTTAAAAAKDPSDDISIPIAPEPHQLLVNNNSNQPHIQQMMMMNNNNHKKQKIIVANSSNENPFYALLVKIHNHLVSSLSASTSGFLGQFQQQQQQPEKLVSQSDLERVQGFLETRSKHQGGGVAAEISNQALIHLFATCCSSPASSSSSSSSSSLLSLAGTNSNGDNVDLLLSCLVYVLRSIGFLSDAITACHEVADHTLVSSSSSPTSSTLLRLLGKFLSHTISSGLLSGGDAACSRITRSILLDSLTSVLGCVQRNGLRRGTVELDSKVADWIGFARELIVTKRLGIFVFSPQRKRDALGVSIEVGAQFCLSLHSSSSSSSSSKSTTMMMINPVQVNFAELREQLEWPERFPSISVIASSLLNICIQNLKQEDLQPQVDAMVKQANITSQILSVRLLSVIVHFHSSIDEVLTPLELSDGSAEGNNKNNDNNSNILSTWKIAKACIASFLVSDLDWNLVTQDDDTTRHFVSALSLVASAQRPLSDSLLEFAQLLTVSAVLGSAQHYSTSNNSNQNQNQNQRQEKSQQQTSDASSSAEVQKLIRDCVLHAEMRRQSIQGQSAAVPFIDSSLRGHALSVLSQFVQ